MQSECLTAGGPGKPYANLTDLWDTDGPAKTIDGEYEEAVFRKRVLAILHNHEPSKQPLFLLYTPHVRCTSSSTCR